MITIINQDGKYYSDNYSIAEFYNKNHSTVSRWMNGQEALIDGKTKYRLLNGLDKVESLLKAIGEGREDVTIVDDIANLQTVTPKAKVINKVQTSQEPKAVAIIEKVEQTPENDQIASLQNEIAELQVIANLVQEQEQTILQLRTELAKKRWYDLNIADLFRSAAFKSAATIVVIGITASMCYLELAKNQEQFNLDIPSWLIGALAFLLAVMVGTAAANFDGKTSNKFGEKRTKVNWAMIFFNIVEVASAASFFQLHETDFSSENFNVLVFIVTILFTFLLPTASAFLNKSLKK